MTGKLNEAVWLDWIGLDCILHRYVDKKWVNNLQSTQTLLLLLGEDVVVDEMLQFERCSIVVEEKNIFFYKLKEISRFDGG